MLGGDLALCLVGYPYRAVRRRAQADDVRERGIAVAAVAPRAADAEGLALFLRLGAHRGQLVLRQIAAIGFALGQQFGRDLGMARRARELEYRLAVPIQLEPLHPVENRVDRGVGRARAVGVLDPQQEFAARVAREEPVEQS